MISENLLTQTLRWVLKRQLVVALLLVLVLASALGVAVAAHQTRQMYSALQDVTRQSDKIDSEYEKLLLEQSAWADYTRIDKVSREELGMVSPVAKYVVVVER